MTPETIRTSYNFFHIFPAYFHSDKNDDPKNASLYVFLDPLQS